jgi:hypothetical protein
MGQGLYVCLPAEQLTLAGFAQGGEADTMAPGPLLAAVVHAVAGEDGSGLGGCSDDQLMGIISAARRMESRAAWTLLAATAEFAARHDGTRPDDAFAADELAAELHLTALSAQGQMDYASTVATRLPATFAALAAGRVHPVHVRIIEDEASILSAADAATADAILAEAAPGMTFGELRSAAHKLVLQLDPEAVQKRKEAARREAHVRRFREDSGNAGMVARELPSAEVLASWQHVEQRALDLRAAGMPGTLRDLRVQAYLDLLQERDSRDQPADPGPAGPVPAGREGTGDPGPTDPDFRPGLGSDPAGSDPAPTSSAPTPRAARQPTRPAPRTSPHRTASPLARPAPAPDRTVPAVPVGAADQAVPVPVPRPRPLPAPARRPGRASRRWSPSRFPVTTRTQYPI